VTRLLLDWRAGDGKALDELVPHIYGELRRLARRHMSGERRGHTLQTTALVHEVYARLVDAEVTWQDRAHFYAVAARAMRRVLVDHARSKRRAKRGSGAEKISLDDAAELSFEPGERFLDLDLALGKLAGSDARKAQVVELHYFGGLGYDEIAEVLQVSPSTVGLDLRFAKAWLARELGAGAG
jgi:RNA polymerase sigma factor (TIGR02999 family)